MSYIVLNQGSLAVLESFFGQDFTLRLFTNNHTVAVGDTDGDYTEMTSGGGYTPISLSSASWTLNPAAGGSPAYADYAKQTFTFTAAKGNAYGYYVTRDSDDLVVLAEGFGEPFDCAAGAKIEVTITKFSAENAG